MYPRTSNNSGVMRRSRGVVTVITLLGLLLLAAVIFWVLNIGQQVNRRVQTQNAADAAVQAAGGWAARSFNSIAANNTGMARTIAAINVLDSFPQASEYAEKELVQLRDSLVNQINLGVGGDMGPEVLQYYQLLLQEMQENVQQLEPVVNLFASQDVSEMTVYPSGHLWNALFAQDEMNRALAENFGAMVQYAGQEGGKASTPGADGNNAGFMVLPLDMRPPFERGTFDDLRRPVRYGMLPLDIDDALTRRGPWDTVFGWRDVIEDCSEASWVPGSIQGTGGGGGGNPNNPVSRSEGGQGNGRQVGCTPVAYRTYGPHEWLLRRVRDFQVESLKHARLAMWLDRIAEIKLDYLWPLGDDKRKVFEPEWIIDYQQARQIAMAGMPEIRETAFFVVEIKSRYAPGSAGFMSPGSWALAFNEGYQYRPNPRVARVGGWSDPQSWGLPMINPNVWRDEWQYQVQWDSTIGIEPIYDANGIPMPQDVFRIDHIAWGGINVGPEPQVRNPYEGFNQGAADAPAPVDLNPSSMPNTLEEDPVAWWQNFHVLAVARATDAPQAMGSRFRGGRPYANLVAVSQVRLFNNHSLEAWTQMWHAELCPVTNADGSPGLTDWVSVGNSGAAPPDAVPPDQQNLMRYLEAVQQWTGAFDAMGGGGSF